ncbi:MAG: formate dehydrogenase accessory sulfurtransferase FdhD [Candidatus Carbobacillus altaicus]|uniref:Formate dehydrogenase assembly factor FdhD n=1 Tax=Candidatus Carbonibacillus altaicus TaxID=2163959 RepID=A0A2R6XYV2_9BACL|nr:formate dehydrogenase accessory sulfurtransferase FdhD [Candidatus Carbobacillus altaicus]PTQ55611.1 MAG: Formate dehydrogenase assembly factor FdhD [Candidatus Carbobacillus altaicus]
MKGSPDEYTLELVIGSQTIGMFQITDENLDDWIIGFLYLQGWMERPDVLKNYSLWREGSFIQMKVEIDGWEQLRAVRQNIRDPALYAMLIGQGDRCEALNMRLREEALNPVQSGRVWTLTEIQDYMKTFIRSMPRYEQTGGMHAAALVTAEGDLLVREDIGRHNAIDKVIGYALKRGWPGENLLLLATGRITLAMMMKAATYGISVMATRSAATRQAVALATQLGIDTLGYVRGGRYMLYTPAFRVKIEEGETLSVT